ncbi:NUDIX domain-containing protein [Pontibacter sp. G13]|uniref:NUDIX domain-containing protein n=1 Tax=Pontibacter sp. G13 TaxID=3074898 RepID=UPI00288C2FD3|nr:NUDIX domain-containing protein [Pontibacter sp. G13]WNJ16049.1 NUDIX domain-containing protein [Pontibacter sp. G13]
MTHLPKFCEACGSDRLTSLTATSTLCLACQHTTYRNPLPVVLAIVPVDDGVLLVKRGEESGYGSWAFPGGFLEANETWQEGTARELREETGLVLPASTFSIQQAVSVQSGSYLLIFSIAEPIDSSMIPDFKANEEVLEIGIQRTPIELAFEAHTQMLKQYFETQTENSAKVQLNS